MVVVEATIGVNFLAIVWGLTAEPQRGPEAEPLVRGQEAKLPEAESILG